MRTVTVTVTAEDIASGEREKCERCPIALALRRATGEPKAYADAVMLAAISADENWFKGATPDKAFRFMCEFDGKKPVEPFTFTVELS